MSKINYLDEVYNPISGCSGKGCKVRDNCWARGMVKRFPQIHDGDVLKPLSIKNIDFSQCVFHPSRLDKPLHWKKPRRIGVAFTGDLFDEQVPFRRMAAIFGVMTLCPQHQFFVLTKQPQTMLDFYSLHDGKYASNVQWWINEACQALPDKETLGIRLRNLHPEIPLPNTYLGVSITDQDDADWMIPELLKIPGKHWISIETMLGPVDLNRNYNDGKWFGDLLHWVVIGCESGPRRRPMPLEWAVDVVRQCKAAKVPVWVKQLNIGNKVAHDINLFPPELQVREEISDYAED